MLYLSILFAGTIIGFLLRRYHVFRKLDRSISYTIWIMLFVFGITIGSNRSLMENVSDIGFQALIMAVCGIMGSVLAALLAYKFFYGKKKGGEYEK